MCGLVVRACDQDSRHTKRWCSTLNDSLIAEAEAIKANAASEHAAYLYRVRFLPVYYFSLCFCCLPKNCLHVEKRKLCAWCSR